MDTKKYPVLGIFWGNGRKSEGIVVFLGLSAELSAALCANLQTKTERESQYPGSEVQGGRYVCLPFPIWEVVSFVLSGSV